ncbi:hypothetical protein VPH35_123731 [Triticum aestivum]
MTARFSASRWRPPASDEGHAGDLPSARLPPPFISVLLLLSRPHRARLDPWPLLKPSSGLGHDRPRRSRPPSPTPPPASPSPRPCSTVAARRLRHLLQPRSKPLACHGQRPWRTHLRLLTRRWPASTSTNISSI